MNLQDILKWINEFVNKLKQLLLGSPKQSGSDTKVETVVETAKKSNIAHQLNEQSKVIFDIAAPCDCVLIKREDIPDPGFSEGAMGEGFGIEPISEDFKAFINGELSMIFRTRHAYFMTDTISGVPVMLHIGINTVEIPEEKRAFETIREQGVILQMGDDLCTARLETIKAEGKSIITALLVTADNMEGKKVEFRRKPGEIVKAGEIVMSVVPAV